MTSFVCLGQREGGAAGRGLTATEGEAVLGPPSQLHSILTLPLVGAMACAYVVGMEGWRVGGLSHAKASFC